MKTIAAAAKMFFRGTAFSDHGRLPRPQGPRRGFSVKSPTMASAWLAGGKERYGLFKRLPDWIVARRGIFPQHADIVGAAGERLEPNPSGAWWSASAKDLDPPVDQQEPTASEICPSKCPRQSTPQEQRPDRSGLGRRACHLRRGSMRPRPARQMVTFRLNQANNARS